MDMIYPAIPANRPAARESILRRLDDLPEGKAWRVSFREWKAERSGKQNRFLFGVAYQLLSESTGYSAEDLHDYFCGRLWGWQAVKCPKTPNNPEGTKDIPVRTTTRNELGDRDVLDWDSFWQLVELVQRVGAEHGVMIPDPDPSYRQAG